MYVHEQIIKVVDGGAVMESRDDLSLLRAVGQRHGSDDAFSEIQNRYQKRAYNLAFRILRDPALAQDAVQEAMFSIWRSAHLALPAGSVESWIMRIVINKSVSLGYRQRRTCRREGHLAMEQNRPQADATEASIEASESIAILRSEIDQLPELERILLAGIYGANMSQQEIAKLVGISQQTVSNRIQQILDRLRLNLSKAGVAAVLPVFSAENLFEAVTTGHNAPPGLTPHIMQRIAREGVLSRGSQRFVIGRSLLPIWGGIAAAACAGLLWYSARPPIHSAHDAVPESVGKEKLSSTSSIQKQGVYAHWNFRAAPPTDLQLILGNWHWQAGEGMSVGSEAMIVLPPRIRSGPLLMTIRVKVESKGGSFGAGWSDGVGTLPYEERHIDVANTTNLVRKYLIGRDIVDLVGNQVTSVSRYGEEYPGGQISMGFRHITIQEIELRSVPIEEIPAELLNPEKLMSTMKAESQSFVYDSFSAIKARFDKGKNSK